MKVVRLPIEEKKIRSLKIGDPVLIYGTMVTGRDEVHRYLVENDDKKIAKIIKDTFIYHCGPIVMQHGKDLKMVCCGPTTSIREEPYQADVIERYGIRGIIGKGGMNTKTLGALKEHGGVYLQATGGAAALLSSYVKEVVDVHFLDEFGRPEAMWVIRVEDFPAIVTMDSHGNSLHEKVLTDSAQNYKDILDKIK